jgi:hypothetical protein
VVVAEWWQRDSSSAATAAWRWWQCGSRAAVGSVAVVLTARWWRRWQHASSGRLGGCGRSLAALQRQWRQQSGRSCTTVVHRHSGNEDTGGNSNGRGTTNNQQSTKSGSSNGDGKDDNDDTYNVSNGGSGGSLAAVQHWHQRQCSGGSVSSARQQRAAVRQ